MASILNILYSNDPSHAAVVYLHKRLCTYLENVEGHTLHHVVLSGGPQYLPVSDRDNVFFAGLNRKVLKGKKIIHRLRLSLFFKKLLSDSNTDLVICDGFGVLGPLSAMATRITSLKVMGVIHGPTRPRGNYDKSVTRLLDAGSAKLVGVSEFVKKHLCSLYPNDDCSIDFVNNAVDFKEISESLYSREYARGYFNINHDDYVVASIGRIVSDKRHDTIIKAVQILDSKERLPKNLKVVIFGAGPLLKKYQEVVSENGLSDHFIFTGHVENVTRYLSSVDLYIMASEREGFGLALLEAIAAHVPCLASDSEAFLKIISDRDMIFSVGDAQKLSEMMLDSHRLFADEEYQNRIRKVYKDAERLFCIDNFYKGYSSLIKGFIGAGHVKKIKGS